MNMEEIDIQDYARQLLEAHGDKQLPRRPKELLLSKRKARRKTPKLGGTSKGP
jgi:hypothetical protein